MTGYTDTIRRYASDNRYCGRLEPADGIGEVGLGTGEAGSRLAVRFTLKVEDQRVTDIRFQVFGCGFTIAACAAAAELATGQSLSAVGSLDPAAVATALQGLPEERSYCADLAIAALQAAVTSVAQAADAVRSEQHPPPEKSHGPRVGADHPRYRSLLATPVPPGIAAADRHLFACLLAVASDEAQPLTTALGLTAADLDNLLSHYFPGIDRTQFAALPSPDPAPPQEDLTTLLLNHVPQDAAGRPLLPSLWLARILAARAAQPGHLWVAMGLFQRPQLSAAISRHLPSLAAANAKGMRWKRFLFKEVCRQHGGMLCKAPNCGVCSDYAICFAPED